MPQPEYTLLTWIARSHDPDHAPKAAEQGSARISGPTLTLLTHERSPYRGLVKRVVILSQKDDVSRSATERTKAALRSAGVKAKVEPRFIDLTGPTDHLAIRDAVAPIYQELLAEQGSGRKLLVNLSPGTPAMHAVWLLLTETDPLFDARGELVETLEERHVGRSGPMARVVKLNLRTEFKLHASRVMGSASADTAPIVDPSQLKSPAMRAFYEEVERVAALRVPVLIRGERGTGKTTVASYIRSRTPQSGRSKTDVAWQVACGSFTPELVAAELFGYVKGAFTGAVGNRDGLLATVGDGALFLDEVGDLTKPMQRTLIKVVEEGEFRPVGSATTKRTRARLVFATNIGDEDLLERIDADFLDRVGYVRLHVPPLRDCREDIPDFWRSVATVASERADFDLDGHLDGKTRDAVVDRLKSDPLPGNFRDLFRVAYRLCVELQRAIPREQAVTAAFHVPEAVPGDPFALAVDGWRRNGTLESVVRAHGPIPVKNGMKALERWFGVELTQAARKLGLKQDDVSDLPARTLRDWATRTR